MGEDGDDDTVVVLVVLVVLVVVMMMNDGMTMRILKTPQNAQQMLLQITLTHNGTGASAT